MQLGYACINQELSDQKITVNRGMIRRTFDEKGPAYASELILLNLTDLLAVMRWNFLKGIHVYRLSSDMIPWMSEYTWDELPDRDAIDNVLQTIGLLARAYQIRLSFHPGPFNVLASENEKVVEKTILDLNQHAQLMDKMGLSTTPYNKINIHVGSTLGGDKAGALRNFCRNFARLDESTRQRLTIENDDKGNMYTVGDLYEGIYQKIGIPIVFDFHHHFCHSDGVPTQEALHRALSTWPAGITPMCHYSEPRSFEAKAQVRAHADYIVREIPTYGYHFDVVVEAKEKERAVLHYLKLQQRGKLEPPYADQPFLPEAVPAPDLTERS
ncbi:UV DNA damage endonuclease [Catalinimonas alkaloidigena]|uniref:UV DNA damage endonuclease n=1 Tax=Catalinimonas alkaloidigena TaxID=1075417 RepID=A0A1G9BMZ0_9BACT|nr:UV DNA damage repair endonuclease UvsE [Catalinimonas alkaloidigena]SDK40881.1 UV DNA damage endonuclease [Catalinimonas alkaloidigena]